MKSTQKQQDYIVAISFIVLLVIIAIVYLTSGSTNTKTPEANVKVTTTKPKDVKYFNELAEIETTTTTTTTEPIIETRTIYKENPKLNECAQALYDTQLSQRAYFDAMRAYQSAYVLQDSELERLARESEEEADRIYAEIWQRFVKHCDEHVTNRRMSPWG